MAHHGALRAPMRSSMAHQGVVRAPMRSSMAYQGALQAPESHTHESESHTHESESHTHESESHTHESASHTHESESHTHESASPLFVPSSVWCPSVSERGDKTFERCIVFIPHHCKKYFLRSDNFRCRAIEIHFSKWYHFHNFTFLVYWNINSNMRKYNSVKYLRGIHF